MENDDRGDEAGQAAARRRAKALRHRLLQVLSLVVIVAVFAFIFPQIASYRDAWTVIAAMSAPWLLAVIGVTLLNLVFTWWFIMTCLPGLTFGRSAAMNLSSTAVANTVPFGGAIALGVSWTMAATWGFSGEEFTLYTLISGLWSQFAKFGTPAIALLALLTVGDATSGLVWATVIGAVIFVAAVTALVAALRRDRAMAVLGRSAQRAVSRVCGLFHRTGPRNVERGFLDFKHRATDLLRRRGWWITLTTVLSDLGGWFVQWVCLRACGVTSAEVSWQHSFAGFALIRLLTTIPITPGGLGITEVGLTSYLAAGASGPVTDRIAAAVLLSRALTFLAPIPFGAGTFAVWKVMHRDRGLLEGPSVQSPAGAADREIVGPEARESAD